MQPLTVSGEHITKLTLSYTGVAIVFDDLRWNTEPIAGGDAFSVGANGTLNGNLLGNDSDADNDPLTAAVSNGPAHGSVSVRPDGGFTYTPAGGFSGSDSFSYHVNDGDGEQQGRVGRHHGDPAAPAAAAAAAAAADGRAVDDEHQLAGVPEVHEAAWRSRPRTCSPARRSS